MSGKQIALVLGRSMQIKLIESFRLLSEQYRLSIFILKSGDFYEKLLPLWGQVKLYEEVDGALGYMRGLERDLKGFDAIVAFETFQLSTIQALRASTVQKIPLHVYVSCDKSYGSEGAAIHAEVIKAAQNFIVPANYYQTWLVNQGVSSERIFHLAPLITPQDAQGLQEKRQKFRKYIGLGEEAIVALFYQPLEKNTQPDLLVKALALMQRLKKPAADRINLIFVGNGGYAEELKYLAYNLGLGGKAYFVHQNPEPFLSDLYAACDFLILPELTQALELARPLPLFLLEGMSHGLIPFVAHGGLPAELIGDEHFTLQGGAYENLSETLSHATQCPENMLLLRQRGFSALRSHYNQEKVHLQSLEWVQKIFEIKQHHRDKLMKELTALEAAIKNDKSLKMVQRIKKVLRKEISLEDKSKLFCLQGELYTSQGCYDEAVSSFEQALQLYEYGDRPYRGLGYVSWHNYSHEEAMTFFRKALALNPKDSQSLLGIGLVYKRVGMIEDAIFWMEKSIEAYPSRENKAVHTLIQSCLESQNSNFAITVIERIIDWVGEEQPLMQALGHLHVKTGNADKGHEIFAKYFL